MATETIAARPVAAPEARPRVRPKRPRLRLAVLFAGALLFLFPFYYMLVGSLQAEPNTGLGGLLPDPGNLTLQNYAQIDKAISLARTLFNSGVFTGGVILCTVVFGLLAGYALAVLEFRGKGTVFAGVMLILVVPFQLLTIPLYVLIVRDYGLADNYLGMSLPFAINSTAVFVFRQFFLQEAEGVLNPASGRTPDGRLYLLPRLVGKGNVSRVGLAEVVVQDGVPVGVERRGVVLGPDEGWERGAGHAGVEDPRVTWVPSLRVHVMTYVAYGPLGPTPALAVSEDLVSWRRLGPLHFAYQPGLDTDLNLFPNKDCVWFPEPIPNPTHPDGELAYAMLHRPMWDLGMFIAGAGSFLPAGVDDDRPGIWISYVPVAEAQADVRALVRLRDHSVVTQGEYDWEALKIGAGPPPVRVPEGWLVIHHGVDGELEAGVDQQQRVRYAAGALLLDPEDPSRVLARTPEPLLAPESPEELAGIVPNVVFPTAIEAIDGVSYVFYGMADTHIGVARLDRA